MQWAKSILKVCFLLTAKEGTMITVQNNDVKSINAALLKLQNNATAETKQTEIVKETVIQKAVTGATDNTALINSLQNKIYAMNEELKNLLEQVDSVKNISAETSETLQDVSEKVNLLAPYSNTTYIQSVESAKIEAIETAVAEAGEVDLNTLPRYIGSYDTAPVNEECNKGDWYFDTTDVKLYVNHYDEITETYSWNEVPNDEQHEYMYNSASKDLLQYASDSGNVGVYAKAFINHLMVNKLVVQDSIESSNYSEENGTGYKMDSNGDIYANNGFFRGVIAMKKDLTGSLLNDLTEGISFEFCFSKTQFIENEYKAVKKYTLFLDYYEEFDHAFLETNSITGIKKIGEFIIAPSQYQTADITYSNIKVYNNFSVSGEMDNFLTCEELDDGTARFPDLPPTMTYYFKKIKFTYKSPLPDGVTFYSGKIFAYIENIN